MEILPALSLLLLISVQVAVAQYPWAGACPNIPAVKNFRVEDYDGIWYEGERYCFLPEVNGKCISLNFTVLEDGTMDAQVRFTEGFTGTQIVFPGNVALLDGSRNNDVRTGNLQMTLTLLNPIFPQVGVLKTYNYRVVATDYDRYAIHYACYSLIGVHFTSVWVVVRDPTYPQEVRTSVRQQLRSLGINADLLERTDQNCENPPVPLTLG